MKMRRLPFVSAIVAAAALSGLASGAASRVSSLPKAAMSATPSLAGRPYSIPASEKVDGIHPALPPDKHRTSYPQGSQNVSVYGTAADAAQHAKEGFVNHEASSDTKACFTVADFWHMQNAVLEWPLAQGSRGSIHGVLPGSAAAKEYQRQTGPHAIHVERLLLAGNDSASLRITDAWLDPVSLGSRRIGETTMPLAKVAQGPSGVRVFAARDETQDAVHFVVHAPPNRDSQFVGRHIMLVRGGAMGNSDCGFARMSLRSAPGAGESGTMQIEVLLPSSSSSPPPAAPRAESPVKPLAALFGKGGPPQQPREIRLRTLMVNMSVSQSASDKEPVASVSFGWHGRERRMQVF